MEIFWIVLIVLFASLIKGITGFGFALVSLPLLLIWYSPVELIPVLILCNLVASIIIVLQRKEQKLIDKQFRTLIIYGAVFTLTGVLALNYFSEGLIIQIMSVFFMLLSVLSLIGIKYRIKQTPFIYKLAGAILGFLTGSISISGPPLALFLHSAKVNNQQFREIFAWFSIVTSIIALVGYAFTGILTMHSLQITALFLPILFIGSYIGKRINQFLPVSVFEKSILLITLGASIFLLVK
ncbi:MAG: sulfite exporter TauE/SafE family protein [Bacteroidales bacterium]|nr:sulfite exporter TauE/SafE family protein [Bacteroidales bacterium]